MKKHVYILLMAYTLLIIGCGTDAKTNTKQESQPIITVSIEPLRYMTEQIVGDKFQVVTFVPEGKNPESYDPSPKQMMKLSQSPLFLMIGELGFERMWSHKISEMLPDIKIANISPVKGNADPHVWTSPKNMRQIAQNIFQVVCTLDSTNIALYSENLGKINEDMDQLDEEIRHFTDSIRQRTFLIYHPSLTYFAHEYGLTQLNIENEGKEPSVKQLAALIEKCKEHQVATVFVQKEFDVQRSQLIANEINAKVVVIDPLSYDWRGEMLKIAKTLCAQ